jgi:hypothetical protein
MKYSIGVFFAALLLMTGTLPAFADLLVTPKRVVFDDRDRTQQVVLINSSNTARSYRLEWREQQQLPNGGYKTLTQEEAQGRKMASEVMRFSPRQVRLAPGERQVIKILVRRRANMELGEYRSHILFAALPIAEEPSSVADDGIQMRLNVLVSYSIPVIMNVGYEAPQIFVSDMKVTPTASPDKKFADIELTFDKTGDYSAYGKIKAYYRPASEQDYKEVAVLNGVNMFAETNEYLARLAWMRPPEQGAGDLKILIEGDAEHTGLVFAEEVFSINL